MVWCLGVGISKKIRPPHRTLIIGRIYTQNLSSLWGSLHAAEVCLLLQHVSKARGVMIGQFEKPT